MLKPRVEDSWFQIGRQLHERGKASGFLPAAFRLSKSALLGENV